MEKSRNGGGKVVTFEQAMIGRRRNGSLSSYLDIGRDVDAGRVAQPLPPQGSVSRRRTYADGELDVFAAERYFKGAMDGDGDRKEGVAPAAVSVETAAAIARRAVPVPLPVAKPSSARESAASVSASSAASANSQTVLLPAGRRRHGYSDKKCCVQVGVLMRACSGKRSVRVDSGGAAKEVHVTGEPAASRIDWYRELRMQKASIGLAGNGSRGVVAAGLPPNLNLGTAKVAAIGRDMAREEKTAEFTCSSSRRSFTLVAPVRAGPPASGRGGDAGDGGRGGGDVHNDDGDAGSESSSDLFEIKSLTIDDCPYEPSEASIQWSVVTASAADASERGDRATGRWIGAGNDGRPRGGGRGTPAAGRSHRDRPVGLLAGCVSHRAVDVSAATTAAPATVATRRRSEGFQKAQSGG
ncbi:hypothetical protein ACP70R_019381 [Stipagrostis hirtigluma subsp. patula]